METQPEPRLRTLDLAEFAHIGADDTVIVESFTDRTQDLFERTLELIQKDDQQTVEVCNPSQDRFDNRFIPLNEDLRKIYLFAEALGGYDQLNELVNEHSPSNQLTTKIENKVEGALLRSQEIDLLEQQHKQLTIALESANQYLKEYAVEDFNRDEMGELHHILVNASMRNKEITKILGQYKIKEIEKAVERLYEFHEKIQAVEKSVSGIFMVDSEVLFIPTRDLIDCVNVIFSGVGNPYLADNIDGVLLLAARNLLIEAVSFYSYYGKERIYNLLNKGSSTVSTGIITHHIRNEIYELFKACEADNKLVLKRIMKDAERQFEISVESIQEEAERTAVAAVQNMLPKQEITKPVMKKSLFRKILSWFKTG